MLSFDDLISILRVDGIAELSSFCAEKNISGGFHLATGELQNAAD